MQILCENVKLGYGSKVVFENLNFEVMAKDYLVIIGENGAGKSTLIKSILGLIPTLDGKIEFNDGLLKNEIGYLPQQLDYQKDFPATVYEVVLSGCLNKSKGPFYSKLEKQKALEMMEKLSILDLKKQSFRNLSGGQRQRVLLARALCATSKVLLLDEPVAGLDPNTTAQLYNLIQKLNEEITIIMISHDINTSLKYASHILKLGKNPFYGTKDQYISQDKELCQDKGICDNNDTKGGEI